MTLTAARAIRAFTITIFALVVLPLQAATPDTKIPAAGPGHAAIASAYPLASEAGQSRFSPRAAMRLMPRWRLRPLSRWWSRAVRASGAAGSSCFAAPAMVMNR
jgi:hypothetical protein